jgi:hypothetical protein
VRFLRRALDGNAIEPGALGSALPWPRLCAARAHARSAARRRRDAAAFESKSSQSPRIVIARRGSFPGPRIDNSLTPACTLAALRVVTDLMDEPSRRRSPAAAKGWSASAIKPRLLSSAQWRLVIEQRKDLDDELRRLAMREHEVRR